MEPIKKTLYPKTKRVGSNQSQIIITEKLDGSNLGIFRQGEQLIIAQRNNVFTYNPHNGETNLNKNNSYKGLIAWLKENGRALVETLHDESGVFGEWIGMGKIDYSKRLNKRFYIFAKANLEVDFVKAQYGVKNIYYDRNLFIYPFNNQTIPEFMGVVPKVWEGNEFPQVAFLDSLYIDYVLEINNEAKLEETDVSNLYPLLSYDNKVEGFIINNNNVIQKYVRLKSGKLEEHYVRDNT